MQVLSLIRTVLPDRRNSLLQRSIVAARRGAIELVRGLIAAILRRLDRLIAPPPAVHRHQRRTHAPPTPMLPSAEIEVEAEPDLVDPGWIDGLLARVKRTRTERDRAAALAQTLNDLERLIPLLGKMNLGADGLLQSYHQIQTLTDPHRERTGFELNMAWMLLERELRTTLQQAL